MQLSHDPSIASYYINERFYQQLVAQFSCQAQVAQHQTRLRRKAVQ